MTKIKVIGIEIEVDDETDAEEVYQAVLEDTQSFALALAAVDEINNKNYEVM